MSMYNYKALCQSIDKMPDWKAAALCAVCASKVTPIIAALGLPDTWRLVEECLQFVWQNFDQSSNVEQAKELVEKLEATPEWQCEDNYYLLFAVRGALTFVEYALVAVSSIYSPKEQAKDALSFLNEIADRHDVSIEAFPGKAVHLKLQQSEKASQERLVRMLERENITSNEIVNDLRKEANAIAELFKVILPIYAYDSVSDILRLSGK